MTYTNSLRFVTLNCYGVPLLARHTRSRLRTMARELNDADLDLVCLQEVQLSRYVPLLRQAFYAYPHAAYQPFIHAPKGGLLTLSRHPIERSQFTLYKERGWWHTPSVMDWILHKGWLSAWLHFNEHPILVINTHLAANYDGDWSERNRYARLEQAELRQLAEAINLIDHQVLVIACGDFNIPRASWLYNEFVAATGMCDVLEGHTEPSFRLPALLPQHYAQAIDHVLVRVPAHMNLEHEAEMIFQEQVRLVTGKRAYLSDHFGIAISLRW